MKDLSLHILDLATNSIEAGATFIRLLIKEDTEKDTYTIEISDNGKGMDRLTVEKVTDPFFTTRTTRKVGLGIPLIKENAERTGGSLRIESMQKEGTTILVQFGLTHIDRPPEGNLAEAIALLAVSNPLIDFLYEHETNKGSYHFDTREVKEILQEIPINDVSVYPLVKQMIASNLEEIKSDK